MTKPITAAANPWLDKLEEQGFVTQALDPGDRRSLLISITGMAQQASERYSRQIDYVAESMLAGLTESERQSFAELLGRIALNQKSELGN